MDRLLKLTDMEMDALREVGNIGVGNAATSLSSILNKRIQIVIPDTKFIPISRFSHEFGGPDKIVTAIYMKISGDLEGEALFMFTQEDALKLIDLLNGQPVGTAKETDEMGMSALKEMTNIFAGSYLTALSNLLNAKILPSVPHCTSDMVQAVIDFVLAKVSAYANNILAVKTKINIEGDNIAGDYLIFFHVESYQKILASLKSQYGIEN